MLYILLISRYTKIHKNQNQEVFNEGGENCEVPYIYRALCILYLNVFIPVRM